VFFKRFTLAEFTPGRPNTAFSTLAAQAAQLKPVRLKLLRAKVSLLFIFFSLCTFIDKDKEILQEHTKKNITFKITD
jgi:hypothetical protein